MLWRVVDVDNHGMCWVVHACLSARLVSTPLGSESTIKCISILGSTTTNTQLPRSTDNHQSASSRHGATP